MGRIVRIGQPRIFEDKEWHITLYTDRSLTIKYRGPDSQVSLFDYNDACDFLCDWHEYLKAAPLSCPINKLANAINYPICLFEDWLADGEINRQIRQAND